MQDLYPLSDLTFSLNMPPPIPGADSHAINLSKLNKVGKLDTAIFDLPQKPPKKTSGQRSSSAAMLDSS
jgi:hypothetical protein